MRYTLLHVFLYLHILAAKKAPLQRVQPSPLSLHLKKIKMIHPSARRHSHHHHHQIGLIQHYHSVLGKV